MVTKSKLKILIIKNQGNEQLKDVSCYNPHPRFLDRLEKYYKHLERQATMQTNQKLIA